MKRRIFTSLFILFCITSLFTSCDKKQMVINELENFTKELYLESSSYTELDWENAKVRYQAMHNDIVAYAKEFTEDEKKYISKLQSECYAYFTKNSAEDWWKQLKRDVISIFDEFLEDESTNTLPTY